MKKVIYLLITIFLLSAASRSMAQVETRSITETEKYTPTIRIPIISAIPDTPDQPRIRYYPAWNIYYDSEIREYRVYECLVVESTINYSNTPTHLQVKVNGIIQDWKFYPTRVYLKDCTGSEYSFDAYVPSNDDANSIHQYSPLNEVDGGLIFDFDF